MHIFLVLGITIIIGVIGARVIRKLKFPSVVGWLIIGAILGPSVLKLFTPDALNKLSFIPDITLALVGFIIGAEITVGTLKKLGGGIAAIIIGECFVTFLLVFVGIYFLTHNLLFALLFGPIAAATAPAGTVAVLEEYKAKGPFTKILLIVVGVDDALTIIIYVFAAVYAKILVGMKEMSGLEMIGKPLLEIVIAIGIGGIIGWALGFFTQKVRRDEILLPLLLGTIFICIGLSKVMHFPFILATLVLGVTIVNTFPRVCTRMYRAIEPIMPPFYVCFFTLAGAHLELPLLLKVGIIGIIYIICRTVGKIVGAWLGATIGKEIPATRRYLGFGLISQAGVAIGLAYLVMQQFVGQEIAVLIMTIIPATTIIFEIIGPMGVKFAITKAKEIRIK